MKEGPLKTRAIPLPAQTHGGERQESELLRLWRKGTQNRNSRQRPDNNTPNTMAEIAM